MLAVIGIVYGALVAMVQPDMKKLVAYSSVSHLGFVVLGICAMNVNGVQGAVYQMLAHGISTGGLFLIVGMLSDRRHTRLISEFGGLSNVMPRLTAAFLIMTLASIGMPALNGFVGEFLTMLGAYRWDPRYVVGRRPGRDSLGRLHAVDVPARLSGRGDERGEQRRSGSAAAGVGQRRSALRHGHFDGDRADALHGADGTRGDEGGRAGAAASDLARSDNDARHAPAVAVADVERPVRLRRNDAVMLNTSFDAILPMLCVTLAALVTMVAEAFRRPGERMPLGLLGVIGLVAPAVPR